MGWSPREVDRLSLWELTAAADGFAKANGAEEKTEAPTYDEHLEMVRRLGT